MAQGVGTLPRPLKDRVSRDSEDHRSLLDLIDQSLTSHTSTINSQAALITALQAQIAALQKKVG